MQAFIIHTNHANSLDYANQALASFSGFKGWEPQLFLGLTVETLPINGASIMPGTAAYAISPHGAKKID